jgi:putative membrane protein
MKRSLCLTAVFIASLTACKQNNGAETVANNTATAAATTANMAGNEMATNAATTSTGAIDTDFLTDAIKGDNSEIQLGQLAEAKGGSKGVKDFGKTLVTDHGKAKDQASALAKQANMPIPTEIMDEAKTELQKLQGMSGAAFDKEFVSYMVQDHQKDIANFEQQANGTGPTADLAKQTLPTLKKHLSIAQGLQGGK